MDKENLFLHTYNTSKVQISKFTTDWKNFFNFSLHHSSSLFIPYLHRCPGGGGGSSRPTIQRLDRLSATATTIEQFFREGWPAKDIRATIEGPLNRAIWFTSRPLSVLSGVVAAPFWQRDASGGPDTRELEKPAAHFRADNAVIDKLCGPGGGVESIRGRWRPCHRDPARFIVCFVFCNFYFEIAFFCVLYFVIWLTKHSKRYD